MLIVQARQHHRRRRRMHSYYKPSYIDAGRFLIKKPVALLTAIVTLAGIALSMLSLLIPYAGIIISCLVMLMMILADTAIIYLLCRKGKVEASGLLYYVKQFFRTGCIGGYLLYGIIADIMMIASYNVYNYIQAAQTQGDNNTFLYILLGLMLYVFVRSIGKSVLHVIDVMAIGTDKDVSFTKNAFASKYWPGLIPVLNLLYPACIAIMGYANFTETAVVEEKDHTSNPLAGKHARKFRSDDFRSDYEYETGNYSHEINAENDADDKKEDGE